MSLFSSFRTSCSGGIAVIFAMALPVLAVVSAGAVELTIVEADQRRTKDVADGAALFGAQQFAVAPNGAADRTKAFAVNELADMASRSTMAVSATTDAKGAVTVSIDTHRDSFFGDLLPPGGFFTHVSSTAVGASSAPLCVLSTDPSSSVDDLHLLNTSKLEASQCMIQSDHNLLADSGAAVTAAFAAAVGSASGNISPAAGAGAQTIADPFVSLALTPPTACNAETTNIGNSSVTLQAGLHCGTVALGSNGVLTLGPGTHWFRGNLDLKNKSTIDGTQGATLVFLNGSIITMAGSNGHKSINLRAAKTGPLAGFVLATTRDYTTDFILPADAISELTGTVYVPNARLIVDGMSQTGKASPWTVVVAKGLQLINAADIVMNSNYGASDVPVPAGVGPSTGGGRHLTS